MGEGAAVNLHDMSEFKTNINVALELVQTALPRRGICGVDEREMGVHIGEMAEKSGLSSRTLRHYEEIGLIPATGRTEGGFRVYTDEDLRRLMTIRRMKALNYSTAEMGELLVLLDVLESDAPGGDRAGARKKLFALLEDANAKREKLARQVERADEFLGILSARLTEGS